MGKYDECITDELVQVMFTGAVPRKKSSVLFFKKPHIHEKEAPNLHEESPFIGELPKKLMMFVKLIQTQERSRSTWFNHSKCFALWVARHIAHLAKLPFVAISAAQIHSSKYVGDNIKEIDSLFEKGKDGIIFIDELDALGARVDSEGNSSQAYRTESITHLLTKLDGFQKKLHQ